MRVLQEFIMSPYQNIYQKAPFLLSYQTLGYLNKFRGNCELYNEIFENYEQYNFEEIQKLLKSDFTCFLTEMNFSSLAKTNLNNQILVQLNAEGQVFVNKNLTAYEVLQKLLFSEIKQNRGRKGFYFELDENATYQSYIYLYEKLRLAYREVWNEECQKEFGVDYSENLPFAYRKLAHGKYPIHLYETVNKNERLLFEKIREAQK